MCSSDLEDHLEEAARRQDRLADVLATDPAKRPGGWPLRGEILAHVDRLRTELEPRPLPAPDQTRRPRRMPHRRSPARRGYRAAALRSRAGRVRARLRVLPGRGGLRAFGEHVWSAAQPWCTASTLWPSGSRRNTA